MCALNECPSSWSVCLICCPMKWSTWRWRWRSVHCPSALPCSSLTCTTVMPSVLCLTGPAFWSCVTSPGCFVSGHANQRRWRPISTWRSRTAKMRELPPTSRMASDTSVWLWNVAVYVRYDTIMIHSLPIHSEIDEKATNLPHGTCKQKN